METSRTGTYVLAGAALVLLLVLASVLAFGYFDYRAVTSVRVKDLEIVNINLIRLLINPSELELTVELHLENPSGRPLEASQLIIALYVEGKLVGKFSKRGVEISPGETSLRLPLRVSTESFQQELDRALSKKEKAKLKVSATVELPVSIFGIPTPWTHSAKYESVIEIG